MADLKCYFPEYLTKNNVTISGSTINSYKASCSVFLIEPVHLVVTQYAAKRNLKFGTNLIYYIYIINNLKCDICNINLKDILPKGVKVIYTHVRNGYYEYYKDKIFYHINFIRPYSFCKIAISVYPLSSCPKVNSIEVISKQSKCTANNPCKISCEVNLTK